jgi:lincosamide nucleotidyltransferase A/C/D/E
VEAWPAWWAAARDLVNAGQVIEVLDRLRTAGIEFWVEGGWGVDALLGEQTRSHDDLDLGVLSTDVVRICAVLSEFERSDDEWPSSFVLRDAGGRKVDCHPLTFDENGDGWQPDRLGGPPHRWPGAELRARGHIAAVEVPCISPELQLRWHVYPEFDDVDWEDVRLLCEHVGLDAPPECRERPGFVAQKRA